MKQDYKKRFKGYIDKTLYTYLDANTKEFVRFFSEKYKITFQEFNQLVTAARDLEMWDEKSIMDWWNGKDNEEIPENQPVKNIKDKVLKDFYLWFNKLKEDEKEYFPVSEPLLVKKEVKTTLKESNKKIYGLCPVASPDTICCRLNTIDAALNCSFGCSYCTIQTFYSREIVFDKDFAEKLKNIKVQPGRFMRFGSGQSSDSLIWGNKYNILGSLFDFAEAHPQILLELKTKSDNVSCLLERRVPGNVVCTWSLNPDIVIANEEHFTPDLKSRLDAARTAADNGIKVGFHFHPMIYYKNWSNDYSKIVEFIINDFSPESVLFVSFGTLTFIKPVIRKIRQKGSKTKILQMPFASDPKGKITYPDKIKIELYKHIYNTFSDWHNKTYFYLCMEKKSIWKDVFGFSYSSNEEFEKEFGENTMKKINPV